MPSPSRSSRPEVFFEKVVLKNFAKFTRKHQCQSFFFNKVAGEIFKSIFFYRTPLVAASVHLLKSKIYIQSEDMSIALLLPSLHTEKSIPA